MLNGASAWFGLTEHQAGSFHPHYDTSNDRSRVREILMTIHRPPAVGGQPRLFLQLEGGALLAVATAVLSALRTMGVALTQSTSAKKKMWL
jgi:hypothetical protein